MSGLTLGALPTTVIAPGSFAEATKRYQAGMRALWDAVVEWHPNAALPEIAAPDEGDRRFRSPLWRTSPFHSLILQSYLLYARYLVELTTSATLPPADKRRLAFLTRQYLDALSPSNFPATNPDVLAEAVRSDGASLMRGAANFAADVSRGRITTSDERAFHVGRNIATTPGAVVFRNELIELIQYAPTTPRLHARPLLIVPPSINKYYVLDLSESNSFVRYAISQGNTTFIISWRNIPPELGRLTWDDYLERGVIDALRVAREITGQDELNALGFCVGGTLLACALAVLAARGDDRVTSATFLTTMLDFDDPGEIGVYVTRDFLASREHALMAGQRMHGAELASAFSTLRANDLVWNYVVGNYLKGETPPAFDLLYWNGDSANLPGPMFAYYLREMYLANRLREPAALTMAGEPIDLAKLSMPTYVLATREDHIVPWQSAYRTTRLVGGKVTFALGASGHIAGVINPAGSTKRNYWIDGRTTSDPEQWLASAHAVAGSWWPHWSAWLERHAGGQMKARNALGNSTYPQLEPAPGRYVIEQVA